MIFTCFTQCWAVFQAGCNVQVSGPATVTFQFGALDFLWLFTAGRTGRLVLFLVPLFWGFGWAFMIIHVYSENATDLFQNRTPFNFNWTVSVSDSFVKRSWVSKKDHAPSCSMPILHLLECFAESFWFLNLRSLVALHNGELTCTFGTRTQLLG